MVCLDEMAKRKASPSYGPDRCHPVRLANGQDWLIPRPRWSLRPRLEGGKCVEVVKRFGYAEPIDDLVEAIPHADDALAICIVASIAGDLLRQVYDLTEAELDALLGIDPGSHDPLRWVRDVMAIVTFQADTLPPTEATAHV